MKKITAKKTGSIHAGTGRVKSIRMGSEYGNDRDDDGLSEISIAHGEEPKRSAKKNGVYISPMDQKHSRLHIPHEHARKLKIGQRVKVHLEPL